MNISGVGLRDAEVDAQRIHLLDMEHFRARVIRNDQVADVQVARGDNASERRGDAFECDLLFENAKVGGEGVGISLGRILVGGGVLGVKLGDDAFVP